MTAAESLRDVLNLIDEQILVRNTDCDADSVAFLKQGVRLINALTMANELAAPKAMSDEEKLKHCSGCHDDFYNQPGNSSGGRCWSLRNMVLEMRKEVSIDQRPPWNQRACLLPRCYHRPRYVYVKPDQTS